MLPPNRQPPSTPKGDFQKPGVVFQPETYRGLQKGVNLIANAIRPTLGPVHRYVGIERILPGKAPELLDSGGTIARRIYQVEGRNADVGAMYLRHVLWSLQERVGDGTTTAAILLQSLFNQGVRYVSAGGNAQLLRAALEASQKDLLARLDDQARPLQGRQALAEFAQTICYDPELSQELGGVFDILGPYGRLEIRTGRGRDVSHEFVQGVYWDEGALNPDMIEDKRNMRSILFDAAVLATDLEIKEAEDTIHLLEFALREGMTGVLLICRSIEGAALAPLLNPANREKVKVVAVKCPGNFSDVQSKALTDIAILTGARPFLTSAGNTLRSLQLEDFGQARRAWTYRDTFGITTGKGDPQKVRRHVDSLRKAYLEADKQDRRTDLEKRLGRMMGGSATLWIGASGEDEFEIKKAVAERASRALRSAMIGGVIPGGGTGLLACRAALEKKARSSPAEETRVALRMLAAALEEPFRVLMENAGTDPGKTAAVLSQLKTGRCFDVRRQKVVDGFEGGVVDSLEVIKQAMRSAISGAALLLTTEAMVHGKNPPEIYNT